MYNREKELKIVSISRIEITEVNIFVEEVCNQFLYNLS